MSEITLGIIGGGQLGSMLAIAAKKLNVKTVVFCDDVDAPAQNFCNQFVTGSYDNKEKISEFVNKVDLVTYEFENIPYETCLLYTSPSPRDKRQSRMPSSA